MPAELFTVMVVGHRGWERDRLLQKATSFLADMQAIRAIHAEAAVAAARSGDVDFLTAGPAHGGGDVRMMARPWKPGSIL